MTGRGFSVLRQLLLDPVKQIFRDDGRDTVWDDDVPIFVFSDIAAVAQHVLNAVEIQRLTTGISDAAVIQPIPQLLHRRALVVFLEHVQNKGSGQWVDLKMLFLINHITDGKGATVELALQRIFFSATDDLFRQIGGVIFRITFQNGFQNDTLRTFRNHFRCGHHFHAVPLQLCFVSGTVVTVSRKPVQLPDDDHVKQLLAAVFNHFLKIRSVVRLCGIGTVNIVAQNRDAVLFGKGGAFPNLTFDGFLPLAVGGIAGVNDSFHFFPSVII